MKVYRCVVDAILVAFCLCCFVVFVFLFLSLVFFGNAHYSALVLTRWLGTVPDCRPL